MRNELAGKNMKARKVLILVGWLIGSVGTLILMVHFVVQTIARADEITQWEPEIGRILGTIALLALLSLGAYQEWRALSD
jgi:hypothetical protein